MKDRLTSYLDKAAAACGIPDASAKLDYPEDPEHGDFSSNLALIHAKKLGMSPHKLAEKIVAEFEKDMPDFVKSVSIAGPGFINFSIKDRLFAEQIVEVAGDLQTADKIEVVGGDEKKGKAASKASSGSRPDPYGWSKIDSGKKILIEYTDPNAFKVFHIGHLMANAIGESISRLIEYSGADVVRLCYPSDIGLHIAKSIWALQKHASEMPADDAPIAARTAFLGKMYVEGINAYEADPAAKDDIDALNKVIHEKSSPAVNAIYEKGRKWSLDHFELLYDILGTKFDEYINESDMAPVGLAIVKDNLKKGIFSESEGAIIYDGKKRGLHTRVFINSHGLPTYEAKEMGLNITKFKHHPDAAQSIVVTASEQNEYFKVVLRALSEIDPAVGAKTMHIGHGMLRFASGKMSSRTGKVITAEALLHEMKDMVKEKMSGRELTAAEIEEISECVAVAAVKYTILRSSIGGNIVFDSVASISFEGDSGPYLQYSAVRAASVIGKSNLKSQISNLGAVRLPEDVGLLEKLISRFPDTVERARREYAPQHVANYLINLAGAFNSFYARQAIIDDSDPLSPYRVALTRAFLTTLTNGLWLLGIKVPRKM